jgi:hypothetical protein
VAEEKGSGAETRKGYRQEERDWGTNKDARNECMKDIISRGRLLRYVLKIDDQMMKYSEGLCNKRGSFI